MRIATVIMRLLTPRRQVQLRDLDRDAPGHIVQDVLHDLPACPLVTASNCEIHDDNAEGLACDAVTRDLIVTLACSRLGPSDQPRDHGRIRLDRVLEGPGRSGHGYEQVWDGGWGNGCLARSSAVSLRFWSRAASVCA